MASRNDPPRLSNRAHVRDLGPHEWERLRALFEKLLEAADPEEFLSRQDLGQLADPLRHLWRQHEAACRSGFLQIPIASVRSFGMVEPSFRPGQILTGRFTIERMLGGGGMGEVYLARDQRLEQPVALKTIRRRLATDPAIRRRFIAEVQNARRVTHANVCRIFELFDDGEVPFLVMEYLDGPTLSEWLANENRSTRARRRIALNLAEGLDAAHAKGIIHRDFKPDNVILIGSDELPQAVITDFGLARSFSEHDDVAGQSMGGGTRDYMAPELRAGAPASKASDMYAFGVVIGKLIPGHRFAGECMARNPERRPKSLDVFIRQLRSGPSRRLWMIGWVAGPAGALVAYEWGTRSRLAFTSRERLMFAPFSPASAVPARTIRELLITALRQSPLVAIVPDDRVRTLSGGAWPSNGEEFLAVARRAQVPFVVEGVLHDEKRSLNLVVEILDCMAGKQALRVSGSGDGDRLVGLADRIAMQLRRDFGESETSLRATYKSLADVTSASAEAVEAYFQGMHLYEASDGDGALTWFDRAIEIDPRFALAHLGRAQALAVNDRESDALSSYERAFELRARVSDRERLWIEALYANMGSRDVASAAEIFRRLVRLYPEEAVFQRQLGVAYARLGQPQNGLDPARKAVELDALSANNRNVVICNLAQAGLYDDALDYLRQSRNDGITSHLLETGAGLAYMGKGEYNAAFTAFRRMTSPPELELEGKRLATGPMILQGRFAEAARELETGLISDSMGGPSRHRETHRVWLANLYWLMDQPGLAHLHASETAQADPLPIYLPFFGPTASIAFQLNELPILQRVHEAVLRIASRWPSTFSNGTRALCEALLHWVEGDSRAGACFAEARGFWPDPLTLFWTACWQSRTDEYSASLASFGELRAAVGTLFRYHFVGLWLLAAIEEARCLYKMSRFAESRRLYKQVLEHWEEHARSFGIVQQVRTEYITTQKKDEQK